jgi:PQQ-dependent dehydrogenase (s-GDH family)
MRPMYIKLLLTVILVLYSSISGAQKTVTGPLGEKFSGRVVAKDLNDPWEITFGPDNQLWVTESKGYIVSRIDPTNGQKTVLLDLNSKREFPRYDKTSKGKDSKPWPQGGLMGMALHPDLLTGKPFVYLMYVYHYDGADKEGSGCADNFGGCRFRGRIVRYDYDKASQKLVSPIILCDSIPQSNDHNGGRLAIAPSNGKFYLYHSTGDMGAGQFGNAGQPNHAQNINSYEGKILRFNTEPDTDKNLTDKWIPNDNPFNGKAQSAVWSTGHRNPQGLAYAVINGTGYLYQSEHGPFSDDEINIISKGKNYGHPLISGYADGNYDGLAASVSSHESLPGKWNTTYPLIVSEKATAKAMGNAYHDPIMSLYPNSNAFLTKLYNDRLKGNDEQQWQSEAPSSIDVYTSNTIPGWQNSLLIPTLKGNKLIRLKLNKRGDKISGDTLSYFANKIRYRDIAISSDGRKIYLAVDRTAASSNPAKENPEESYLPGTIIEYTYIDSDKKSKKGNQK